MKKLTLENLHEFIVDVEKQYNFNDYVWNYVNEEDLLLCETADEVIDYFRKLNEDYTITDTEVIYYASAMEYLSKNDPSLRYALEIAHEY
jgi:hypothetical protein